MLDYKSRSDEVAKAHPGPASWADFADTGRMPSVALPDNLRTELASAAVAALSALGVEALSARGSSPNARADDVRGYASPQLLAFADGVASELISGCGVLTVTGLPVSDDDALTTMGLLIFSAGLGVSMPNNRDGILAWPLIAEQVQSSKEMEGNLREGNMGSHLIFHTDTCSFAGLLCVTQAETGGENLFVSIERVHDIIESERPDLLAELYKPVFIDRKGEEQDGCAPYATLPVFSRSEGRLQCQWTRTYTVAAYKKYPVPPLTPLQDEALRYLEKTTNALGLGGEFSNRSRRGDLALVNNNKVFHSRGPFVGDRHLKRVWIDNPRCPAPPHTFGYDADSRRWPG